MPGTGDRIINKMCLIYSHQLKVDHRKQTKTFANK